MYAVFTVPINPPGTSVNLTSAQFYRALHAKTLNDSIVFPQIIDSNVTQVSPNQWHRLNDPRGRVQGDGGCD